MLTAHNKPNITTGVLSLSLARTYTITPTSPSPRLDCLTKTTTNHSRAAPAAEHRGSRCSGATVPEAAPLSVFNHCACGSASRESGSLAAVGAGLQDAGARRPGHGPAELSSGHLGARSGGALPSSGPRRIFFLD